MHPDERIQPQLILQMAVDCSYRRAV